MTLKRLDPSSSPRMDARALLEIKQAERERLARLDAGLLPSQHAPAPVSLRILILVDNRISFNHAYFGLGTVLDTLRENPEYWANFEITRAHRQRDRFKPLEDSPAYELYGPHYEDFRFDQPPPGFRLEDYHQLWLFGFNADNDAGDSGGKLDGREVELLSRWMSQGGGVLAMGDHWTLGEALCSRLPRVRSMRKWKEGDKPPPQSGEDRYDTLLKGRSFWNSERRRDEGQYYTFDDESDDVPMRLRLRLYAQHERGRLVPHPLLQARDGRPIDHFPDHPHEGEVVVPEQPDATEYPQSGSRRPLPEIIAWARVQGEHGPEDFKGKVQPKEFGAVGAYDGHPVGVGRVVVDSTWHHWFDVNLTGRPPESIDSGDERKLQGFNDTAEGKAMLERIKTYFRNVALWLAPATDQPHLASRLLWGALERYPLVEELRPGLPVETLGELTLKALPAFTGSAAGAGWGASLSPEWAEVLNEAVGAQPAGQLGGAAAALQRSEVLLVGSVVKELLTARQASSQAEALSIEQIEELIQQGVSKGLRLLSSAVEEQRAATQRITESLGTSLKRTR